MFCKINKHPLVDLFSKKLVIPKIVAKQATEDVVTNIGKKTLNRAGVNLRNIFCPAASF